MEKYYNDKGEVAVLYSPGYGAGWYSWHKIKELLFDPKVVQMVLDKKPYYEITNYCEQTYGDDEYYGGADQLKVMFLKPNTLFYIDEYDGCESIITKDQHEYLQA